MTDVRWIEPAGDGAVVEALVEVLERGGKRRLAVPGGSTPRPILERLAARWSPDWKADIVPTDERLVSPMDPASNWGAINKVLGRTGARIKPLTEGAGVMPFDLVWVGMGEDGHIASLFPNEDVDADAPAKIVRRTPDPLPPEAPYPRLTLTLKALTATGRLIVVAGGEKKRAVLEKAAQGEGGLPIQRLFEAATCPVEIFWRP